MTVDTGALRPAGGRRGKMVGGAALLSTSALSVSLATIISIPVVLAAIGATAWVSIAVGQAIGELVRVVVIWGWNSIGLTVVAALDPGGRVSYYAGSLVPRAGLYVVTASVGAAVAYLTPTASPTTAALTAVAVGLYGLSGGWVFIGGREPVHMVVLDAIPRALSILAAALAVHVTRESIAFPATTMVGTLLAISIPFAVLRRRASRIGVPFALEVSSAPARLRQGAPAFTSAFVLALRLMAPVILAPYLAPAGAAAVALGDKFLRWSNTAMTPVMQTLQVHIPVGSAPLAQRIRRGIITAWIIGGALGVFVAAAVPWLSPILSHGEIRLHASLSVPLGFVVMTIFVAGITGNSSLVLLGEIRQVMRSALAGLTVMAVAFPLLAWRYGAVGAFWGLALAELTVTIWQLAAVVRALRRHEPTEALPQTQGGAS